MGGRRLKLTINRYLRSYASWLFSGKLNAPILLPPIAKQEPDYSTLSKDKIASGINQI